MCNRVVMNSVNTVVFYDGGVMMAGVMNSSLHGYYSDLNLPGKFHSSPIRMLLVILLNLAWLPASLFGDLYTR